MIHIAICHFIIYRLNYINAKDNTLTEHIVYLENALSSFDTMVFVPDTTFGVVGLLATT